MRHVMNAKLFKLPKWAQGIERGSQPLEYLEGGEVLQLADCIPALESATEDAGVRDSSEWSSAGKSSERSPRISTFSGTR